MFKLHSYVEFTPLDYIRNEVPIKNTIFDICKTLLFKYFDEVSDLCITNKI
jgi:hypothetical protein